MTRKGDRESDCGNTNVAEDGREKMHKHHGENIRDFVFFFFRSGFKASLEQLSTRRLVAQEAFLPLLLLLLEVASGESFGEAGATAGSPGGTAAVDVGIPPYPTSGRSHYDYGFDGKKKRENLPYM